MKILVIGFLVCLIYFSISLNQRRLGSKLIKVEGTLEQYQKLYFQLQASTSPHNEVVQTQNWLTEQISPQVDTTNKK